MFRRPPELQPPRHQEQSKIPPKAPEMPPIPNDPNISHQEILTKALQQLPKKF